MFKHPHLKRLLWRAARPATEADFKQCLEDMKALDLRCVEWIGETTTPEHWADLYFKGKMIWSSHL